MIVDAVNPNLIVFGSSREWFGDQLLGGLQVGHIPLPRNKWFDLQSRSASLRRHPWVKHCLVSRLCLWRALGATYWAHGLLGTLDVKGEPMLNFAACPGGEEASVGLGATVAPNCGAAPVVVVVC